MTTFNPNSTQYVRTVNRLRSRHMLPMEMLASVALFLAGVAGAFPLGYLHKVLAAEDLAMGWGLGMIPLSVAAFVVSTTEWFWGAHWENGWLRGSIFARWWISLLSVVAWLAALYLMAVLDRSVTSMVLTAVTFIPFHFWSFWTNLRVHTALDPSKKTERLKQKLQSGELRF